MGKGILNISLRDNNCVPLRTCWKVELYILTCGGIPIKNFDLPENSLYDQLMAQFPGATITFPDNRIVIKVGVSTGPFINDIYLKVLAGCYKIKARVCFGGNETTNEVMAIVKCEETVCVHLLLPEVKTCGHNFIHPGLLRGVAHYPPRAQVQEHIRFMALAAETDHQILLTETNDRITEATEAGLSNEVTILNEIKLILEEMNTAQ